MQIIHKGVFYGLYAALMGAYTDCNIFMYFWHNDYTNSIPFTPSALRRRRQHYMSTLHIYHKAKYTQKDKIRCI